MAETTQAGHDDAHHGHDEIHLPPNSWIPISMAGSMTALLTGFVASWWVVGVGGAWTLANCVAWFRAARTEYADLPE